MNGWTFENNKIMVDVELVTPQLLLVSVVVKGHLYRGVLLKTTSKSINNYLPHIIQSNQPISTLQTNLHLDPSNIIEQKPHQQCSFSELLDKTLPNETQGLDTTDTLSLNPYTSQNLSYSPQPFLSHIYPYENQVETTMLQTGLKVPTFNNEFSSLYNALDGIEPLYEPIDVPDTNGLEPQPCLIDVDKLIDGTFDDEDELELLPTSASDNLALKLEDSITIIADSNSQQTLNNEIKTSYNNVSSGDISLNSNFLVSNPLQIQSPSPILNSLGHNARNTIQDYHLQPFFSPAALFRCTYFRDPAIIADYYHPLEGINQKPVQIGLTSESQSGNEKNIIPPLGQSSLSEMPHSNYYGRDFIWPWPLPSKSQVTRNLKRYRPAPRKYVCARCKSSTLVDPPPSQTTKSVLDTSGSIASPSHTLLETPITTSYTRPVTRSYNTSKLDKDGIKSGCKEESVGTIDHCSTDGARRYFKCCTKTTNTLLPITLNNLKTLSPKGKGALRCGGRRKRRPWTHVTSSKTSIQPIKRTNDKGQTPGPQSSTALSSLSSSAKNETVEHPTPPDLHLANPLPINSLNTHKALPKIRLKLSKTENPIISSGSQGSIIHATPNTPSYEVSTLILPPSTASSPNATRSKTLGSSPSNYSHKSRSRLKLLFSLKKPAGVELVHHTNTTNGESVPCKGRRGRPCSVKTATPSGLSEVKMVHKRRKKHHRRASLKSEFGNVAKANNIDLELIPNGVSNDSGQKLSPDLALNTPPVLTNKSDNFIKNERSCSSGDEIDDRALVIDLGSDPESNLAKPIPETLTPEDFIVSPATTKSLRIKIKPLESLQVGRLSSSASSPTLKNEVAPQRPSVITRHRIGDDQNNKPSPAPAEPEGVASYKLSFTYLHPREILSPRVPDKCLRTGDIVWGKIQGYPWWPGRIMTFTVCLNRLNQEDLSPTASLHSTTSPKLPLDCRPPGGKVVWQKCKVAWFGSNKTSEVLSHEIVPFSQFYDTHYNRRKRGTFQEAVQQAALAEASRINRDSRPLSPDHTSPH